MTETDATNRPLNMPERYIPYMDKYRIYKIFKDMVRDLVIALPRDHLCHMKVFLHRNIHSGSGTPRIIVLVHPDLSRTIDIQKVVKELLRDFGVFIITRRYIIDRYEKHDEYKPGCLSPEMMSEVTRLLTLKDPVPQVGWLMFDHPCTIREARCLQQDGVLPTVTLALMPEPPANGGVDNPLTPARSFFEQDFEGLKYVYRATLKEIYISEDEDAERVAQRCFNGILATDAGLQGSGQGHAVLGAPGVYRVLIIGPRGSGRSTQAQGIADHFGLVCLHFNDIFAEAMERNDEVGLRLRRDGVSVQLRAEIVKRRLLRKDCIDHGWVLIGYPAGGIDFEYLDNMPTPPNRIIFLSCDAATCKARLLGRAVDPCTGVLQPAAVGQPVQRLSRDAEDVIDAELDNYFTESLAEMRAAAGITAVRINANDPIDKVAVRVQAAVMAAPAYDIEYCLPLRNDPAVD